MKHVFVKGDIHYQILRWMDGQDLIHRISNADSGRYTLIQIHSEFPEVRGHGDLYLLVFFHALNRIKDWQDAGTNGSYVYKLSNFGRGLIKTLDKEGNYEITVTGDAQHILDTFGGKDG